MVIGIDEDHDVVVQYPSQNRWTFNPIILKKVPPPVAQPSLPPLQIDAVFDDHLVVGDFVKISTDMQKVQALQVSHGEWVESMVDTLGTVGRILVIYPDGDLKVDIRGVTWTFNPLAVSKVTSDGVPLTPGTSENVSMMLRHVFETHQPSNSAEELVKSAASGDVMRTEEILSNGLCSVDESFTGHTALQAACQNGHIEVVRCLIRYHANIEEEDQDGDRAMHHASFGDEPDIVALLSENGADANARNRRKQTPLHVAVNKGHIGVIKALLRCNCHPSLQDSEGDTPLHDAISKKRDDLVNLLLDGGADVTVTNNNGFSSLHHASLRGNIGALRAMLQHMPAGYSINEPKEDGFTALHLAALNNHLEVAQALIQHGANCNAQNINQQTPLHLAVERQNIQIVRLLVEEGADVNVGDRFGDRPLHEALRHHTISQLRHLQESPQDVSKAIVLTTSEKKSNASIAVYLVSNGADLTVKNKKNQCPLDLCSDPNLIKHLTRLKEEAGTRRDSQDLSRACRDKEGNITDCMQCVVSKRDALLAPCGHITTCIRCASKLKKCLLCNEDITKFTLIEECVVCSELRASVLFQPCMHMVACEGCATLMKKCVACRTVIDKSISFITCCGGKSTSVKEKGRNSMNNPDDVSALQQQLQALRDKTLCQVCMDRKKNCAFLCGHGTCQLCADKITECPICRKPVGQKIILFD